MSWSAVNVTSDIVVDGDGFGEFREDGAGSIGEGVAIVLGEIDVLGADRGLGNELGGKENNGGEGGDSEGRSDEPAVRGERKGDDC